MYRKYVRKEWLLKRNRIICPEVAINEQFLPGKSIFWLPEKIEIFRKFAWKNRNFSKMCLENRNFLKICMEKYKFFKNLPEKIEIFHKFPWKTQNFSQICLEKSKFFVKLPEKIEISLKFGWKNWNLFNPDPRPPDFKPDWRRWLEHKSVIYGRPWEKLSQGRTFF